MTHKLDEKALAAARDWLANRWNVTFPSEATVALLAEYGAYLAAAPSPAPVAVKVKPLEWRPSHGGKWLRATGAGSTYEVRNDDRVDEKKAHVQAIHDDIIRSALVDPVADEAGGQQRPAAEEKTP